MWGEVRRVYSNSNYIWYPQVISNRAAINQIAIETLCEKQPVYLHSMLATSIPSRSLRSHNDNSLSVPRVKTETGARAIHSCLCGTTSCCLSVQPLQLLPLRNIWRHISLIWPFPHRYRHSPWPVDVMELFPRFCCWTLIWFDLTVAPLSLALLGILAL